MYLIRDAVTVMAGPVGKTPDDTLSARDRFVELVVSDEKLVISFVKLFDKFKLEKLELIQPAS